jgi:hypothetical protein
VRRRRSAALRASGVVVVSLAAVGWLLGAPHELAGLRLMGVSLAWWAAFTAYLLGLAALLFGPRADRGSQPEVRPGGAAMRALILVGVWCSPAALLALAPAILIDGTLGVWGPLALAAGACLVAVTLAPAWARLTIPAPALVADVARARWPGVGVAVLAFGGSAAGVLFLWSQLAAGRELAVMLDWSPPAVVGLAAAGLALGAVHDAVGWRVGALGGALTLLGLVVPLGAVLAVTDPVWPRVWSAVAARSGVVFVAEQPSTVEGRAVRGVGAQATITVAEEQRVRVLARGPILIEPWGGQRQRETTRGDAEFVLRPGDRLVVPNGSLVRFEPGRAIPGAPGSGAAWVGAAAGSDGWRPLLGLGLTLLVGTLGLAPVQAGLPTAGSTGDRPARVGAALATVGLVAVTLWGLYALWLTPEIYVAGVAGVEAFDLPDAVRELGPLRAPLRTLARLGLAGGGAAAGVVTLLALRRSTAGTRGGVLWTTGGAAVAGLLAIVTPVGSWSLFVAALGLAAAPVAPGAVLACWRERLEPRALTVGASLAPSSRSPLPPGFDTLHA